MRFLQSNISNRTWLTVAIVNFLIVGILGLLMRLKIILPLPWLEQQHLLHAHSHFAFAGWVTHALMVLVFIVLVGRSDGNGARLSFAQQGVILANLLTAYGMLISFGLHGYSVYSIAAATLSVLVSYWFAVSVWRFSSGNKIDSQARAWFRASVVFLVLSSLGTFILAYLMMSHNMDHRKQLASVYFYLHFQYNGWFLFACMGLFHQWLTKQGIRLRQSKRLFTVFAFACIPTYFLSILWWNMPQWLYGVLVIAAVAQLVIWSLWFGEILSQRRRLRPVASWMVRCLLMVVGVAFSVKLVLQALSLIPELSQFAYGYRPIVIGYLHLVLLVIISLFIMAYLFSNGFLKENRMARRAVTLTVAGIFLNELLLGLQGLSGLLRIFVNYVPEALAIAAILICMGILGILFGQRRTG